MSTQLILDSNDFHPATVKDIHNSKSVALITKCTEGTNFVAKTFEEQRNVAHRAHVPFGSYLFIHPDSKGNEAGWYLEHAKPKKGDIQPIIDAETFSGVYRKSTGVKALALRTHDCAGALKHHGYDPILYCGPYVWKQMVGFVPQLKLLRVWEAQYPARYAKWAPYILKYRMRISGAHIVMWQWTDYYGVDGKHFDASRLFVPLNSILIK